jgi:FkbM family methyltransferase
MQMTPTAALLVVLWGVVLVLGWLVYLLIRQHGQLLLHHDKLQERLSTVERLLDGRVNGVHTAPAAPSQPGLAAPPSRPAGVVYRTVVLKNRTRFEVAIDRRLIDPISRGIVTGDFWFLHDFYLLLDLMKPGDAVLDLGGHVGTFSLAAAALGCRVACIEAAPDNAALLRASVARNGFDRMHVIEAIATDHEGTSRFLPNGPWGTVSNAAVARSPALIYGSEHAPVTVRALTIDGLLGELGWKRVDFIKADVEGSEVAAIRGMTRLLARTDALVLLYESNGHALHFFGETPGRLHASLQRLGYTNYQLEPGRLVPIHPDELQPECVINCFAVKGQPPHLGGWRIVAPRSFEETVDKIISEAAHADAHHRAYIARALADAEPAIRSDPRVTAVVTSLCHDSNEEVRAAAAWLLADSARGSELNSSVASA